MTKQDLASPKRAAGNIMGLDLVDVLLVSDPDVAVAKKSNAGAGAGAFCIARSHCHADGSCGYEVLEPCKPCCRSCAARASAQLYQLLILGAPPAVLQELRLQ